MPVEKPASIHNEEEWRAICNGIVTAAQEVLGKKIGVIEGARKLSPYCHVAKAEDDKDFLFLVGLDSETDHLPLGDVRKHWNPTALARKQKEIADKEDFFRKRTYEACARLIEKYGQKSEE